MNSTNDIVLPNGDSTKSNVHEVPCSTADEFLDAISLRSTHLRMREEPRAWLFRGHGSNSWKLVPSALRKDGELERITLREKPIKTNREQINAEIELIATFYAEADASGLPVPEDCQEMRKRHYELRGEEYFEKLASGDELWPPYFAYSLIALIQHHGLPTRLLDWTYDPKIAAYFAAESAAHHFSETGKAEFVGSKYLAVWSIARESFRQFREDEARDGNWIPTVEVSAPYAEIQNLRAQNGVFLVNRPINIVLDDPVDDRPLNQLLRGKATTVIDYPIFQRFTLPISQAGRLLCLLAIEGVVGSRVFPGYDGVVRAIREHQLRLIQKDAICIPTRTLWES